MLNWLKVMYINKIYKKEVVEKKMMSIFCDILYFMFANYGQVNEQ